jgi:hypothetical protein
MADQTPLDFPYSGPSIKQDTPVGRLIKAWREQSPMAHQINQARHDLYAACMTEIREMMDAAITYDPARDYRVRWAHQFLEVVAHSRRKIDPGLQDVVDFLFGAPPETSSQHRAANDI